ncbi:MAG: hypothetical protein AVW05_04600 [Hadesarchaea archaeon DG-33]|nr:MAG: hypothetical protein AVW05_04600 [Hadesarchaea archaeon DG-33]
MKPVRFNDAVQKIPRIFAFARRKPDQVAAFDDVAEEVGPNPEGEGVVEMKEQGLGKPVVVDGEVEENG